MLGPQDMQGIAKLVDPGFESARESEVDINHLDYGYVEKCTDVRYLKVLLAYLKYYLLTIGAKRKDTFPTWKSL